MREGAPLAGDRTRVLWRCSVAPSAGPALATVVSRVIDARWFFDWGGGLVWLAVPGAGDGGAAVIRAAVAQSGGHATCCAPLTRSAPPFPSSSRSPRRSPHSPRRVKDAFDPKRILNRGRMYADV